MPAPLKLIPPGQGFERIAEALTSDYGSLIDLVGRALRDKCNSTPGLSSFYAEPSGIWPDHIVCKIGGRFMSFPYAIDADNKVTIGEGAEVVLAYTAVREAGAMPVLGADPATTFREAADGSIAVTIIRAGESINGNYYTDAALQTGAPLFEAARVFVKSDAEHSKGSGKDVRSLIGGIYGVSFVKGATPDTGTLCGTFRAIDQADATVIKMTEAVKRGMQGLMGLSIDAVAYTKKEKRGGKTVRVAKSFAQVNSVDLIVSPGAGGGLDRLTEATDPNPSDDNTGETMLKKRMLEAIAAKNPTEASKINIETISDDDLMAVYEAVCGPTATATGTTRVAEAAAAADASPVTRAELQLHQARGYASLAIAGSTLPLPAKERLQADFRSRERFTEAEVDASIKGEREYLARFTESGRPTGGMPRIEVGDRTENVRAMLDAFFDPRHRDHGNVRSFRECYIEITGDRDITGRPDRSRLTESIGTDTFADVLGNSITRQLQQQYRDAVAWDAWQAVVRRAPVNDFRVQERTQMGGFGDLPIVAERGPYTTLTDPSDDKALYSVSKRGGMAQVTMEAIMNDDVGAIRNIPIELGRAAKRTLFTFVMNFFASNPNVHDGLALYHATHNNLFTGALSTAQLSAHRLAMKKQLGRDTTKRMGIGPRFILVPDDLEEAATDMFRRNTNNDKTFVQSLTLDVIPVPTWTDVTDWCTVADPLDIPVLEIGFLGGAEEPVLLSQDNPSEGSVFTNDTISYKVRHTYGGNVLVDGWKGTTKAVVAG